MSTISNNNRSRKNQLFALPVLELEKVLPWYQGVTLRGYSLSYKEPGWLLVVKAERNGDKLVAFTGGYCPFDCWETFLKAIGSKGFQWKKDNFA